MFCLREGWKVFYIRSLICMLFCLIVIVFSFIEFVVLGVLCLSLIDFKGYLFRYMKVFFERRLF